MVLPVQEVGPNYSQSPPPPVQKSTPQPKYYDVDAGRQHHETRRTEMQDIRGKLANVEDNSSDYLRLLDRYQQLEREEQAAKIEVKKALDEGPDPNLNSQGQATYGANLKKLDDDIKATIEGDDDGDIDGMHNLGKGRYLTSIREDGDSMLGTSYKMLGQYGDDARTLNLNRNQYDPNSADSNFNSRRAPGMRDADLVHTGDLVVVGAKPGAAAPDKPELPLSVTDAARQSKAQHKGPNAAQYATGLDKMLNSPEFATADKDKQLKLIHDYDTAFTSAEKKNKPLNENQQAQLGKLLTSPGYYAVNDTAKNKVLELFVNLCGESPARTESFIKLVKHSGFMEINNEAKEIKILDGYVNDAAFAAAIDKLVANTHLSPADQKTAIEYLLKGQDNQQFYGKVSPEDKTKIMNKLADVVTSDQFLKSSQPQKDQAFFAAMSMPQTIPAPTGNTPQPGVTQAPLTVPSTSAGPPVPQPTH